MSTIPNDRHYTASHEWIKAEEDGTLTVGITDYAQALLGDLVFVQVPELKQVVTLGQDAAVVESVKAASDVYAPVSGEIIACNEALSQTPELINTAPYSEGWIFRIKPSNKNELNLLLDSQAYATQIE